MNDPFPPIPPASQSVPPPPPIQPQQTIPPVAPAVTPMDSSEKTLAILCHLSLIFGFGVGFILPLCVYFVRRETNAYSAAHAREVLNFHISIYLYCLITVPFVFILIGIPMYIAIGILALVCSIIGAIRAAEGVLYHYPVTIRLI
jgi:uncharacterized Tic20 family protein